MPWIEYCRVIVINFLYNQSLILIFEQINYLNFLISDNFFSNKTCHVYFFKWFFLYKK
jgi:hypothetical protein